MVSRDDLRPCRGCEAKISVTEGKQASIRSVRSHAHQSPALTVKHVHNYLYSKSGAFYKRPFFPSLGARRSWQPWPSLGEKRRRRKRKRKKYSTPRFNEVKGLRSSRKSRETVPKYRFARRFIEFTFPAAWCRPTLPAPFPRVFSNLPRCVPATRVRTRCAGVSTRGIKIIEPDL